MNGRRGGLRRWMALGLVLAAAPAAARAQEPLEGVWPDSLGVAADAVPLPMEGLDGMGRCGIVGHAVVADLAALAGLRMYPQCRDIAIASLDGRTLVGLALYGDCNGFFRLEALRSESRREFRVRVWRLGGECRGGFWRDVWVSLPALPEGWSVRFTDAPAPDGTRLGPGWTPFRSGKEDGR